MRDSLLGRQPKDWDIVTDALPEQIAELFPNALGIGAHFGVMTVDGVEIATFREDLGTDGRRPERVIYTDSMYKDAKRRDFTINAMYFDPITGQLFDFFGGRKDIKNKVIRTVGKARDRFAEDGLRPFRAIRLATQLGFEIDPEILEEIKNGSY